MIKNGWLQQTNEVTIYVYFKNGKRVGHIHSTYSELYPYECFWNDSKNSKRAKTYKEAQKIIEDL